jgi:hypothetical protein
MLRLVLEVDIYGDTLGALSDFLLEKICKYLHNKALLG